MLDSTSALQKGVDCHRRGAMPEARLHYESVLKENPCNFEALRLLGALAVQTHSYREADILFEKAISLRPNCAKLYLTRGTAQVKLGSLERATSSFECAIDLDRNSVEGHFRLGQIHLFQGEYSLAIKFLEHASALRNDDPHLLSALGRAWFRAGDHILAKKWFDSAIKLDPKLGIALNGKGSVLAAEGYWQDAADLFERSQLQLGERPFREFNLGNAYVALNRPLEALQFYNAAIKIDCRFSEALLNCGNVLNSLRRCAKAIVCYEMALETRPNWPQGEWNLGLTVLHGYWDGLGKDLYSCPCTI